MSAAGDGARLLCSSLARMNRSIAEAGQASSLTGGGAMLRNGWKDQNELFAAVMLGVDGTGAADGGEEDVDGDAEPAAALGRRGTGQIAPRFTHSVSTAISVSVSFPLGGICTSPL